MQRLLPPTLGLPFEADNKVETSSPLFAMCTEILEYSTMKRQPALADYVSSEIIVFNEGLALRRIKK